LFLNTSCLCSLLGSTEGIYLLKSFSVSSRYICCLFVSTFLSPCHVSCSIALSLSPFISVSFYLSLVSRTFALSFSLSLCLAIFFYYVSRSYTVQYRYSLFFFSLSLRLSVSLSHQDILAFSCSLLSCFHPLTVTFSNFLDILVFLID
jgi:hypothetical protein